MSDIIGLEPEVIVMIEEGTTYYAELIRHRSKPGGPGKLTLFKEVVDEDWDGEPIEVGEWDVITGPMDPNKLDATDYGSIMPPLSWIMVEDIKHRQHPQGHMMTMARLIPLGDKSDYDKRTYDINGVPFMIHVKGTSTGCIAVEVDQWGECAAAFNEAFKHNSVVIDVYDFEDMKVGNQDPEGLQ